MSSFDFTGSYSGTDISTGANGTLVVSSGSGGNYSANLNWSTVGGPLSGTIDGASLRDPNDTAAGYIVLSGELSSADGTVSVVGYTENYKGTSQPGLQFILRVTWARSMPGGAHDLNTQIATFTRN
jgi:hypothetical protein